MVLKGKVLTPRGNLALWDVGGKCERWVMAGREELGEVKEEGCCYVTLQVLSTLAHAIFTNFKSMC